MSLRRLDKFKPIKFHELKPGMIIHVLHVNKYFNSANFLKVEEVGLIDSFEEHVSVSRGKYFVRETIYISQFDALNPRVYVEDDTVKEAIPHILQGSELNAMGNHYDTPRDWLPDQNREETDKEYRERLLSRIRDAALGEVSEQPKAPEIVLKFEYSSICKHVWKCDYQSMFKGMPDRYSCKICGVKQEDVE